ncbi:hypothetical protein A1O3_06104 [Capronia epimyces CBS 606.96]|uniref:Uncharacterized protein n=1 Tax=Capronia epimyces CBS 606.96 TaxID=1182542 RepID=W9XZ86_9EURO|nr:uncharacterized protein A1O3_06104 [Capronia epimyces CBS 606.96]EXJ82291.1 hypothetical protein A1O3_06104 [Capronia epimyces CBS 606.96]
MLSKTFYSHRHDPSRRQIFYSHRHDPLRRQNLFRDLFYIMVSLAKISQPRVGSFTIDNRGFITF